MNALTLIVLAPLAGAIFLGLFGGRLGERLIGFVASATVFISAAASFYVFFARLLPLPEESRVIHDYLFTWINVGAFRTDAALLLDPLSGIYILFITFVGFLIHVFATGYMKGERGYWRFFAYLNLFMFMMLVLVLADNFLLMFVGWEGVGLCSYLLIGFYYDKTFAADAAKKAFIVNRIGDFGFALGVMLLFLKAGTIFYFDDPARGIGGAFNWAMQQPFESLTAAAIFGGGLTTIAALMFIGATGKSAQLPLFVWLPDAMAGPTPVSALIHAATMVTAGVYMVSRASSIFIHAPAAMLIIAVVGAATAIFAATIGLAQWDIKKVLAYSTISQLGYMFLACGVGAFTAGIFHVFTHAFFKALLFLGSGSVIVALHHEQDMRNMGGLKKYLPVTFWTMVCGWLAISGVPLFSGFFSKDEILFNVYSSTQFGLVWARVLWFVGAVTALLTAVYMTRLMVLTFFGERRSSSGHSHGHDHSTPHESSRAMTVPLIILAIGAVVVGYLGIPEGLSGGGIPNYFERLLEPAIATHAAVRTAGNDVEAGHSLEWILTVVSSVIAILGILAGWRWFRTKPLWEPPKILEEKYRVDEAYDAAVIQPIKAASTGLLWKFVDVRIIDGAVNGAARLAAAVGTGLRYMQGGLARAYVAMVVLGALLIIGYFVTK
ncbi:MAG: NADH-quinone oxidoreductase subunit L [Blastocatellia bacterium AA13]|nr:MAG: NADH-quinone oxidoreductase subunit L [Blastocatellia bacterium AA13]